MNNVRNKKVTQAFVNNDNQCCQSQLLSLIEVLLNHPDAWPFEEAVDPEKLDADYFEVIKSPMDFGTIKNRIQNGYYDDFENCFDDIRLVFSNCRLYNIEGSQIVRMCDSVEATFYLQSKKMRPLLQKVMVNEMKAEILENEVTPRTSDNNELLAFKIALATAIALIPKKASTDLFLEGLREKYLKNKRENKLVDFQTKLMKSTDSKNMTLSSYDSNFEFYRALGEFVELHDTMDLDSIKRLLLHMAQHFPFHIAAVPLPQLSISLQHVFGYIRSFQDDTQLLEVCFQFLKSCLYMLLCSNKFTKANIEMERQKIFDAFYVICKENVSHSIALFSATISIIQGVSDDLRKEKINIVTLENTCELFHLLQHCCLCFKGKKEIVAEAMTEFKAILEATVSQLSISFPMFCMAVWHIWQLLFSSNDHDHPMITI